MFLLPLVFVYVVFGMVFSIVVTLICMVMLKNELRKQLVTRNYAKIQIDKNGKWHITDQRGNSQHIEFVNSMRIGSALFLLFSLDGRAKRVLVLEDQQGEAQFHRLKIYLPGISRTI